ncbi:MAG TPA: glycosyltransferase [Rubricoccaceae bacterium]|jgi:hypothetical protein
MSGYTSVGESLARGARDLGHDATFVDAAAAYAAPRWVRRLNWHLRDHRPPRLRQFERALLARAAEIRPDLVVATGQMPITAPTLAALARLGARTVNVSTDDPWNRNSRSRRSLAALAAYDAVFTPRRANVAQIAALSGPAVYYLPFAYDPVHCVGAPLTDSERARFACDVVFVGGADSDRAALLRPLIESDLNVHLYGANWSRFGWAAMADRGPTTPEDIRKATLGASVSLCLVRRANRDGHVMRTFEIAAAGVCMLVEWTDEHEALFGPDRDTVAYFRGDDDLLPQARALVARPDVQRTLAARVAALMRHEPHQYRDRMAEIIDRAT